MITKQQALTATEFHDESGPCNGLRSNRWRRNGATKTWVTRPTEFRVPIKFGLYGYDAITDHTAYGWHTAEDCPARKGQA